MQRRNENVVVYAGVLVMWAVAALTELGVRFRAGCLRLIGRHNQADALLEEYGEGDDDDWD